MSFTQTNITDVDNIFFNNSKDKILVSYIFVIFSVLVIFYIINKKCISRDYEYKYVENSGYLHCEYGCENDCKNNNKCEQHPLYHYNSTINVPNYNTYELDCGVVNNKFNINNRGFSP